MLFAGDFVIDAQTLERSRPLVAPNNDEDGVAVLIDRLLAQR